MKIKREQLNARRKYWRSQIDFQNGFLDNPEKETKSNINAFVKFFRKYDSYTDIRNIISERNRFDFDEGEDLRSTSILIRSDINSYLLPKQRDEVERRIEELIEEINPNSYYSLIKENLGPLVRVYYPKIYFSIDKEGEPHIRMNSFPFKVWKFDNKRGYQWEWEDATYKTTLSPYNFEEGTWKEKPSMKDMYDSFGFNYDPKVLKNLSSRDSATETLYDIILDLLGGKDTLLDIIRSVIIPNQIEEYEKWREEDRKETERITADDDNFGYSSFKRWRFS